MNKKRNKKKIRKLIIIMISIAIFLTIIFMKVFVMSEKANYLIENPGKNETVNNQEGNGKNNISDLSEPDTEQVETKQEVTILENEGDLEIIISEDEESFGE